MTATDVAAGPSDHADADRHRRVRDETQAIVGGHANRRRGSPCLRKARHELARKRVISLVDAISPELARTRADSYAAEVLPLLSACRFLEAAGCTRS